MAVAAAEVTPRPLGMTPARTGYPCPPLAVVIERDRPCRALEDERSRDEQVRVRARVESGVGRPLRQRRVARGLHEPTKLRDGHRALVDPEPVDHGLPDGPFFGIEVLRPHEKCAASDGRHPLERGVGIGSSPRHVAPPARETANV